MITRFRVQNYKALRDVTLDLTPMHLLIGPNDSGKTSILDAVAALCRSVDQNSIASAFTGSWANHSLVWHGSSSSTVHLDVESNEPRGQVNYQLDVRFAHNQSAIAAYERIDASWIDKPIEVDSVSSHSIVATRAQQGFQSGAKDSTDEAAQIVHSVLSGVHVYRWVPQYLSLPVAPDANRQFRMEPSGFGLAQCLDEILSYDRDRFIALENRFRSVFPQIESIKLKTELAYKAPVDDPKQVLMLKVSDGKGIHFQFKSSPKLVSASQVSDGVLLVLAYLAVIYLPEPPRVLLVEEPENGIHPARLEEVLAILRDLVREQDQTQIILTSHSPYVVSLFEPEEVTLCHKGDDGAVRVRRLSDSKSVNEQMDFFTLGEIWTGEGDDALMEPAKPADQVS